MFRKISLGLLIMAATTLSACHDGHHPRGNGPMGNDRGSHEGDRH